ncbi:MAG: BrnT family toxin [Acidobacteriota bacterium]|nr:BrnT family toxin [Acidobacteriota bacterium]
MRYDFDWDSGKARGNFTKHKIGFERATTIFRDPNLISIPDDEHSETEERWLTMGLDANGVLLIISHTFESVSASVVNIRLISARKATKSETQQYEEGI